MKIIYCHCSLYNPGGMERVLLNKVKWLRRHRPEWEIIIVTTDQQELAPFYPFPADVRMIDLGINYSLDNDRPIYRRIPSYLHKRHLHKKRLSELLMSERPDITVSLYPSESSFIPDIKDGSKKVLELHFNRFFRLQYGRHGIMHIIDRYRSRQDVNIARRFDRFVVLTEEDRNYWGDKSGIVSIPNAALAMPVKSDCSSRRVIAVGRLDYQKGFDRLIEAWALVRNNPVSKGWRLDIFGQGELRDMLTDMIDLKGLSDSVRVNAPKSDIATEYASASVLAMTSHYEGFPMVMIEAMSAGLPVVTFDYKCGPRDIIEDGVNGRVVPDGDIRAFADALAGLMADESVRADMGRKAVEVERRYSEESVMGRWINLFEELAAK